MLINIIKLCFVACIFNGFLVWASFPKQEIPLDDVKLKVFKPTNWQLARGYRGHEVTLFAPPKKSRRSVVMIDYAKLKNWSLEKEKKGLQSYLSAKKKWIKAKGYQYVKSSLGKPFPGLKGLHLYNVVVYQSGRERFQSADLILQCKRDIVLNISYLISHDRYANFKKEWDQIVKNIECL